MQSFVTNCFVGKSKQWHFYIPPDLRETVEGIFAAQGVSQSEGITRLIRLLVEAPDTVRPILLGQVPGDAGVALARHILEIESTELSALQLPHHAAPGAAPAAERPPPPKAKGRARAK